MLPLALRKGLAQRLGCLLGELARISGSEARARARLPASEDRVVVDRGREEVATEQIREQRRLALDRTLFGCAGRHGHRSGGGRCRRHRSASLVERGLLIETSWLTCQGGHEGGRGRVGRRAVGAVGISQVLAFS